MSRKLVVLAISVCFSFAVTSVIGEDSPATETAQAQVDQSLLNDLSRIRKQMGGSVLNGSALETGNEGNSFQADLKQLLEKEAAALPGFSKEVKSPSEIKNPTATESSSSAQFFSLVKELRAQSTTLDRIANEIEPTKQYDHADQLRSTATELRKLARQFDTKANK